MMTYDDQCPHRAGDAERARERLGRDSLPIGCQRSIDLSGQVSGTLDLPVQVTVVNRTARVTKIDPAFVRV